MGFAKGAVRIIAYLLTAQKTYYSTVLKVAGGALLSETM
jgi:hypothetical protein